MTARLIGSLFVGVVAWWIGAALNVPVWRTWAPGDRCDLALFSAMAAFLLSGASHP